MRRIGKFLSDSCKCCYYWIAGTAVLFLPAELAEISGRGVFLRLCLAAWGVGCFPSADGSRKADARWYGGRLVSERLRQWCRDNPFCLAWQESFCLTGCLSCGFSAKLSAVLCSCNACLGAFTGAASGRRCACGAGNGMSGQNGGNPLFLVAIPACFWCFWRWRLLRSMRVLPLALPSPSGIGAGLAEMSIVCRGSFFLYFIYPDLKKPVGFAVWKACLLITAVVTVIVLLCLANYGEGCLPQSFCRHCRCWSVSALRAFSDQTGFCFCFGSGWHRRCCFFRVRCFSAPFWGRSYADRRKKSESFGSGWCLRLCLRCHFCPKASWRHSVCGLPFRWLNLAYLVGLPVLLLLLGRKGREKGCIKICFAGVGSPLFFDRLLG